MALDLLTSTVDRAHIVLDIDPDVRAANPQAALDAYRESSDINELVVPDGATVLEVRGLSRTERRQVEGEAGRRSDLGAIMYQRVDSAGTAAGVRRSAEAVRRAVEHHLIRQLQASASAEGDEALAGLCAAALDPDASGHVEALAQCRERAGIPSSLDEARTLLDDATRASVERLGQVAWNVGYGEGYARAVEPLTDDEEQALRRFEAWLERYQIALCRRSVCGVEGINYLMGPDGERVPAEQGADGVFPFGLFLDAYERKAAREGSRNAGAVLLRQLAHHVEQVTRLGKGGLRHCGSPPGTTTTPPSPDGPNPATGAARNPPSTS